MSMTGSNRGRFGFFMVMKYQLTVDLCFDYDRPLTAKELEANKKS
jgi:hypothetical protein